MFALGEHMEDRLIVAKQTEVQCLLIPHYWLFKKKQNIGNIWQRWDSHIELFSIQFFVFFLSESNENGFFPWFLVQNFTWTLHYLHAKKYSNTIWKRKNGKSTEMNWFIKVEN